MNKDRTPFIKWTQDIENIFKLDRKKYSGEYYAIYTQNEKKCDNETKKYEKDLKLFNIK